MARITAQADAGTGIENVRNLNRLDHLMRERRNFQITGEGYMSYEAIMAMPLGRIMQAIKARTLYAL